jgi:hypothetical protein
MVISVSALNNATTGSDYNVLGSSATKTIEQILVTGSGRDRFV